MFVVKFLNHLTGDWTFQVKGVYQNLGRVDLFDKDSCFETREEAMQHIKHTLTHPDCGRWLEYVDESFFEIVEVYPIPTMPTAYTTINYKTKGC
jgi:hypothetical protein